MTAEWPRGEGALQRPLVIGLVNNMAVPAMAAAQAQFAGLLKATGRSTELVCFTMRPSYGEQPDYLPIEALADRGVDGIIVTGMELTAADLRDEWLWPKFTQLYDWAEHENMPALWSCLATHAAVLYRSGIERQRFHSKLSGVFECQRICFSHRLMDGIPGLWHSPHSRYNGLPINALPSRGYSVLSWGGAVGADIFTRSDNAGSVYFQGHPEYQDGTLLSEFLRDLRRYVAGENDICPNVPANYLDPDSEDEFAMMRLQALMGYDVTQAARARAQHVTFRNGWSEVGRRLYANWLDIVAEKVSQRAVWSTSFKTSPGIGVSQP